MSYELTAYPVGPESPKGWVIEPAESKRDWMTQTPDQAALRCLPLLIANQAGWVINCPVGFKAVWNGSNQRSNAIEFTFKDKPERWSQQIVSNFGSGIITFKMPWLFRSSEGIGLLVRGPTNQYKENIAPLDGFVETDWAPYTFTMNWKIVKPKTPIWFRQGEPICMITPYPIAMLEQTTTRSASFDDDPELFDQFLQWRGHRQKQAAEAEQAGTSSGFFRLDYVKGQNPDGSAAREHRSSLKLSSFDA